MPRYEFDAALLEKRQYHDVLARRVHRQSEQVTSVETALSQGSPLPWIRQELRTLKARNNEVNEAIDAFFSQPEIALREAVTLWASESFEHDWTTRVDTMQLYRAFQQWSTIHETECCSRERFEELLTQEASVRFRSEGGRLVALGHLRVAVEAA